MTDKEKAIVMAYTGVSMLTGDKLNIFYEYVEKLMGRPGYTHELALFADEIKEKAKDDFIKLCEEDAEQTNILDNIRAEISCHIIEDDTSGNTPARLRADWAAANKAHLIDIAILDKYKRESENKKLQVDEKIELLRKTYFVKDEYGYTDKELVDKVNELIEQVNKLSTKKEEVE